MLVEETLGPIKRFTSEQPSLAYDSASILKANAMVGLSPIFFVPHLAECEMWGTRPLLTVADCATERGHSPAKPSLVVHKKLLQGLRHRVHTYEPIQSYQPGVMVQAAPRAQENCQKLLTQVSPGP